MKTRLLLTLFAALSLALHSPAQTANTGQIILTVKASPLNTTQAFTPTADSILVTNGSGIVGTVLKSSYLTTATAANTYAPIAHNQAWSTITSTPTTLAGYGIADSITAAAAAAAYQPLDADLTSIAALTTTSFGRALLSETNASTLKSTLAISTSDVTGINDYLTTATAASTYAPIAHNQAWSTITLTPTTLAGYGITDSITAAAAAAAYQPLDSDLTSIAGLTTTSYGRALLTESSASTLKAALGISTTDITGINDYLTTATAASTYQPLDSDLTSIAGLATTSFGRGLLTEANAASIKGTLSLGNVENTALSTWGGSANITNVGTLSAGAVPGSLITGVVPPANLGTGSSINTKYLRGDGTWQTISGGGDALTSGTLGQFAATTSAELRGVLSDESGTGNFLTTNGSAASLTSFPTFNQSTTGNAATATALETARTINGTSFDGTANITVTAAAGTLTGNTLASGVTASSLTSAAGGSFGTAAFTAASAYEVPLTFSTGLTRSTNTITVNAVQAITRLSNLTSNGFVKTTGGDGTLSVDTATYLTGNQSITLSGDISGTGTTAITTAIGAGVVTNAMLAGSIDLTAKVTGVLPVANGGTGGSTESAARTALGLAIGTNVQAWDTDLDTWAGKTAPSGTVIGHTDTQTLTNKTISGSSNTLSNIANASLTNSSITIGGASTALGSSVTASAILDSISTTRGAILYRGASGWAALTPGTDGYFLASNGTGADPAYEAGGGGGGGSATWELISTADITSAVATVDITGITGHRKYRIEFDGVYGASDGYDLFMRVSTDGGSTWDSGGSDYSWSREPVGAYNPQRGVASAATIDTLVGNAAAEGVTGEITLFDPNNSAIPTAYTGILNKIEYASTSMAGATIAGRRLANSAVNAVQFYFGTGNVAGGKIRLFGWNE